MTNYFSEADLMQEPPIKRAAFSDRMAYVMSEMSRLAYYKFEGGSQVADLLEAIKPFIKEKDIGIITTKLCALVINNEGVSGTEARKLFVDILKDNGYELVNTYNKNDSQAFLCRSLDKKIAVLAFRGTEKSFNDFKADLDADLIPLPNNDSYLVHSGYWRYFDSLAKDISDDLDKKCKEYQLFITGHSLGGAIATVATKVLEFENKAATYTFGAPPVGPARFDWDIKTPIYRIVNHVDVVPYLPNPLLMILLGWLISIISLVLGILNLGASSSYVSKIRDKIIEKIDNAKQFRQLGYVSYLVGDSTKVHLRKSVSSVDTFMWWCNAFSRLIFSREAKMVSDHSIAKYSERLAIWALRRNQ